MSKELKALQMLYCSGDLQLDYVLSNKHTQDYKIVEKALQRLEQIDNANPSEALNKLLDRANHDEYLGRIETDKAINFLNENQAFANTIKQALIKAQEQEKVLEIIFEKNVNTLLLELAENVDEYNERIVPNGQLTQEEFNLLKRYAEL